LLHVQEMRTANIAWSKNLKGRNHLGVLLPCFSYIIQFCPKYAKISEHSKIIIIIIIIIIIVMIIFINCNWVVTRWQWLFYMYTNMKKK